MAVRWKLRLPHSRFQGHYPSEQVYDGINIVPLADRLLKQILQFYIT